MGDVIKLHETADPVTILEEHLERAKAGDIKALIIITTNPKDEFYCHSMTGTGAITRAGLCAWAEQVMLDSLERF